MKLNEIQKKQALDTFTSGVASANRHIRKIKALPAGYGLSYHGMFIKLSQAIKRRKRCMRLCNLALRGLLY